MIKLTATLLKFDEQGEKTGWTYVEIPAEVAQKLKPGNKKSFRVKGYLDSFPISSVALIPMGEGNFIMAFNAAMRKGTGKRKGAQLSMRLEVDDAPILPPADLIACLEDEPKALEFYKALNKSHQNYFTKWIESAKTEATKTKRIAQSVNALAKGWHFGIMLRTLKAEKNSLQ
jgi:hypothetical protein